MTAQNSIFYNGKLRNNPKDSRQQELLRSFFAQSRLDAKVLTDEEKEDLGMLLLMSEVNITETVDEDRITKILTGL